MTITRLEKSLTLRANRVAKAIADRDDYIRRVRGRKKSLRDIAALTGLSHETIAKITGERKGGAQNL